MVINWHSNVRLEIKWSTTTFVANCNWILFYASAFCGFPLDILAYLCIWIYSMYTSNWKLSLKKSSIANHHYHYQVKYSEAGNQNVNLNKLKCLSLLFNLSWYFSDKYNIITLSLASFNLALIKYVFYYLFCCPLYLYKRVFEQSPLGHTQPIVIWVYKI